jgi:hypothetical protein
VGYSVDDAPSMTGSIQGYSTRLASAVLEFGPLYRIWCLANQLDIIVKGAIVDMQDRANFSCEGVLTALIGYLRRQEKLIRDMDSKWPYWVIVRWKSVSPVLEWLLERRVRISDLCASRRFTSVPTEVCWSVAIVVQKKLFEQINITFSALQVDAAVMSKQYNCLRALVAILQEQCYAHRDEEKPCDDGRVFTNGEVVMIGQFSVHSGGLRSSVRSTGVAAQEIDEQLTYGQFNGVIRALVFAYLTSLNGIVRILQGRHSAHAESDHIPPILPLELCSTSACDFIAIVRTHKKRIEHHFKERSEEVIENSCDEHTQLLVEVALDSKLKDDLLFVSNQEFEVA